ncbi:sulfate ABC transporter substrate-binding protein [Clostridium nigeriense]|uniref:sulfate ABC transporter substrate-binding protein n=1 Tax=Clostridium nigeriense TaxID=1805470 RepID=UPI003D34746B
MLKNKIIIGFAILGLISIGSLTGCGNMKEENTESKEITLLNVSYDPTRELYESFNEAFSKYYEEKTGIKVNIQQSHGGSGSQARSVIDGLEADVVTLALAADINSLNSKQELIASDWQSRLANNSTPYTSTIVFLVRKGNPKNIKDWDDLIKQGVNIITPNPKTSGGARWNYLSAWGYALKENNNDENKAKEFISSLYKNVSVLDSGARQATTTFVQNNIGDVLISWENEALLAINEKGDGDFEIIVPSISILAEPPVAVVDAVVEKKGTKEIAEEYLKYLYSDEGQEIAAENYYRPRNEEILNKYKDKFANLELFTIEEFGGWEETQKKHFNDGGIFDEIYKKE